MSIFACLPKSSVWEKGSKRNLLKWPLGKMILGTVLKLFEDVFLCKTHFFENGTALYYLLIITVWRCKTSVLFWEFCMNFLFMSWIFHWWLFLILCVQIYQSDPINYFWFLFQILKPFFSILKLVFSCVWKVPWKSTLKKGISVSIIHNQ